MQSSVKPLEIAGICSRKGEFQAALDGFIADYADCQKHLAAAVGGRLDSPARGTRGEGTVKCRMSWMAIQEVMLPTLLCLGGILIGLIS
jgi:hypothetical protein